MKFQLTKGFIGIFYFQIAGETGNKFTKVTNFKFKHSAISLNL